MKHILKNLVPITLTIILATTTPLACLAAASADAVPTAVILEASPTAVKRTTDTTMLQVKNYVLDGLAYMVAKIVLQQITASVVNWINTGFQGSPAFLTNSDAFFENAADQITGAFISNTGALKELCSPFSVDIRLSLAMQNVPNQRRYTCTLNSVINNALNSRVNVNGIGGSLAGFMSGDFSQGGWPAFVAMTSQPQNNMYGAYLTAKSDLERQIAQKQNNIRVDLNMGRGFMSWKNCKTVQPEEYSSNGGEISADANGNTVFKNCETQTPGSVIAGTVDKALSIPQDQLNLADSLNEIVGALFSQLVNRVLTGGLHAASGRGGNGTVTAGVVNQILLQRQSDQIAPTKSQLTASIDSYQSSARQFVSLRQQAVDTINTSKNAYAGAEACFANKIDPTKTTLVSVADKTYAQGQISAIRAAEDKLNFTISDYEAKFSYATSRASAVSDMRDAASSATSVDQLTQVSNRFNSAIQGGSGDGFVTGTDISNAQNDLQNAQSQAAQFDSDAAQYQKACASFNPGSGSISPFFH